MNNVPVKTLKKLSPDQVKRLREIHLAIQWYRDSMQELLVFGCGEKVLTDPRFSEKLRNRTRTEEDDRNLVWTLRNLRQQIKRLEEELKLLVEQAI